jgi:Na+/H+ antiporter NhaC
MASSGAQCNHIDHVKTQLPYASLCAVIAFVAYLIAGIIVGSGMSYGVSAVITLALGLVLLAVVLTVTHFAGKKKNA